MSYYTFECDTLDNQTVDIVIKSDSYESAIERLKDYEVNRAALRYYQLKHISNSGKEKYYVNTKGRQAMALAVALAGSNLGCYQISQYGQNKDYKDCLKDDVTLRLIMDS